MNYSNSKVTMELRELLAMKDENGQPFVLFDFEYPSYYEQFDKREFERKIIDHFYFHQIGAETPARFKHNLKTKLREIMPYYIQMYKSVEIMDKISDPFGNVDVTETYEETVTGTASSESDGSGTQKVKRTDDATRRRSDTPHGNIGSLDDGYLTEAEKANGTSTDDGNTTSTSSTSSESESTVRHTLTRKGNQGVNTYAHDMIEFRQSFINVDMMIIGELRDLFLLIY